MTRSPVKPGVIELGPTAVPLVLLPPACASAVLDARPDHSVTAASCTGHEQVPQFAVTVSVPVVATVVVQISVTALALLLPPVDDRCDCGAQVFPKVSDTPWPVGLPQSEPCFV